MNKPVKRILCLLLSLSLLLALAACGKDKEQDDTQQLSGTVYVPEFMDLNLDLGKNFDIDGGCTDGTNVYLLVSIYPDWEAGETGDTRTTIMCVPLDGSAVSELENFQPGEAPEGYDQASTYYREMRAGSDGSLWLWENSYAIDYDLPEDFDAETDQMWNYEMLDNVNKEYMVQLDSTGTEITRVDVSSLEEKLGGNGVYIGGTLFDADGDLFVSSDGKVTVLDSSMNVLFTVEEENMWGSSLVQMSDGTIGTVVGVSDTINQTYSRQMRVIDKAAKGWGESYDLPRNAYEAYPGGGEYLFYYKNGEALYGYKAEAAEGEERGERLLSWLDADINSDDISFFSFLADGRVVVMTRSWRSSGGPEINLAVLTATERAQLPEKVTLTYATMYMSHDERNRIIDYNKSSSTHRIEVRDYSEYNTDEDYTAGRTKLNTEILAGSVPDIISVSSLPLRQYGAKGILEDLWPYIDNDGEISREKLMDRVFTAAEQDGKLYQVFNSFTIQTIVGSSKVVGEDMGWTIQEFQDALATMPEGCAVFGEGSTKDNMLNALLSMNLDSFVNWETGECSFDSENFKSALRFCDSFPLEFDWENYEYDESSSEPVRVADGRQMLVQENVSDFRYIQLLEAMFGGEEAIKPVTRDTNSGSGGSVIISSSTGSYDGGYEMESRVIPGRYITFKGYPMEDGSCGSSFNISDGLAMSTVCKDKEAAWSFMRELLLPASEDENSFYRWGFSVNKEDFDKAAAEMMEVEYILDENGEKVLDDDGTPLEASKGGWGYDTLNIDLRAANQQEYDQIMELYNTVDSIYSYDTNIMEIVSEVAGSYFSGDKNLEDTASLIQNRVKTYVNEQR